MTVICETSNYFELSDDPSDNKYMLLLGALFWEDPDNVVLMEAQVDQPLMTEWTMIWM
ncbi:hypothetical protein JXA80_07060 [bacterium]|nr:hypothetical protein [candidate division CSSED10-310 bacterium]